MSKQKIILLIIGGVLICQVLYTYYFLQKTTISNEKTKSVVGTLLCSFGIISDIQYADVAYVAGSGRYQQDAINKLSYAVDYWKSKRLDFVVNLGDVIDGHTADSSDSTEDETALVKKDAAEVDKILNMFAKINIPKYHVLGNHGPRNLGCKQLVKKLDIPSNYYELRPAEGWRFLFMDGTDMSFMIDSYSRAEADEYIKNEGHRNLVEWNGGFGSKQLKWLRQQMASASKNSERIIIFCHWPLLNVWDPDYEFSLLWNAKAVLDILDPNVVFMFLSGHMHKNGYIQHNGIHHLTLAGVVTAPWGRKAHGLVKVYQNVVVVEGQGELAPLSSSFYY